MREKHLFDVFELHLDFSFLVFFLTVMLEAPRCAVLLDIEVGLWFVLKEIEI